MHISNWTLAWSEGKCIIIDDSFEHSITFEEGQQARVILQLKITHPDLNNAPLVMHGEEIVDANGVATSKLAAYQTTPETGKTSTKKKKKTKKKGGQEKDDDRKKTKDEL